MVRFRDYLTCETPKWRSYDSVSRIVEVFTNLKIWNELRISCNNISLIQNDIPKIYQTFRQLSIRGVRTLYHPDVRNHLKLFTMNLNFVCRFWEKRWDLLWTRYIVYMLKRLPSLLNFVLQVLHVSSFTFLCVLRDYLLQFIHLTNLTGINVCNLVFAKAKRELNLAIMSLHWEIFLCKNIFH